MVSNRDKWVRIFDIPETSNHKNGFTIYKVISMLYPDSCPDAVTKVTVWKRFNDFKKLHENMKTLYKKLSIECVFPPLPSSSIFKRFDNDTIQKRKQNILSFLEFIGSQPKLFASSEFVKFFETSHTPIEQLNGNINSIRADLNLPEDSDYLLTNSDDDHTISDTDSVTTISSLNTSVMPAEFSGEHSRSLPRLRKLNSSTSITSKNSDSISISNLSEILLDGHIYPTPPQTPSSLGMENYIQYIVDASLHINLAKELESDKKFEEAFLAYKTAIDILLKYGKDDTNYDRKKMVRYKTDKYLLRAEKIYNMYLAPEVKNLEPLTQTQEDVFVKKPVSDLYKYKVAKIISSGMLVLHSELQQLYYIKVIHKTVQFTNEHLILPENVPYMVKLQNYYNCENAVFLVLQYCSGVKLSEYLKRYSDNPDEVFHNRDNEILKQIHDMSDVESECSYSELIHEYTSTKKQEERYTNNDSEKEMDSDDSYVKVNVNDLLAPARRPIRNILDERIADDDNVDSLLPTKTMFDFDDNDVRLCLETEPSCSNYEESKNDVISSQRKLSDNTNIDDDFNRNLIFPEKTVVRWAAQLLLAIEKLHRLGVTCRDLQSHNILIDENGDLALTYMCNVRDLCELFSEGVNVNLAPELYGCTYVTKSADWWCFGSILYELLVGMPLSALHPNGVTSFTHLKIPKYVSPEGRSILKQLLTYDPHDRLGSGINGTANLKSHPFFSSISWDSLLAKCHL